MDTEVTIHFHWSDSSKQTETWQVQSGPNGIISTMCHYDPSSSSLETNFKIPHARRPSREFQDRARDSRRAEEMVYRIELSVGDQNPGINIGRRRESL